MLQLQNLTFSYALPGSSSLQRSSPILSSINLTLKAGQIYGLLGASGCGKTTLLRLILGRLEVSSGSIRMYGRNIGTCHPPLPEWIGYMPQETVLYDEFRPTEMLLYFARLYGLKANEAQKEADAILDLLGLASIFQQKVGTMSGGQQRRVSLAIALLHRPSLLILDEPTVGMDPVLREIIWTHLRMLTMNHKRPVSVLLTTHYIEEARGADIVGFLRTGQLLAQDSPEVLMERFHAVTIEAVFLKLCRLRDAEDEEGENKNCTSVDYKHKQLNKQTETTTARGQDAIEQLSIGTFKVIDIEKQQSQVDHLDNQVSWPPTRHRLCRRHMVTLIGKNIRQIARHWSLLIFFLLLPAVEMALIMLCIGRQIGHIPVAVYNAEATIEQADLSTIFLASIPGGAFELKNYATPEEAIRAVEEGEAGALLEFSPKFSAALRARFFNLALDDAEGNSPDNDKQTSLGLRLWNDSSVYVRVDNANQLVGLQIQRQLLETFLAFARRLASSLGLSNDTFRPPVAFGPPIYGLDGSAVVETFIAPGALIMIAFFATTIVACHLLIQEIHQGLIERAVIAGVTTSEFLAAHVVTQTVVLIVQLALMLWTSFQVFAMPYLGSLPLAVALVSLQGLCGLMYGLMLSATCADEIYATTLAIGTFFPSVIVGGIFWPLEAMPVVLQYISLCLPSTQSITALRAILLKRWGLERGSVATAFGVSSLWLLAFLGLALRNFHRN